MTSLLDQVQEKVDGHRYDSYIAARCMFHGDSHASLMIYEDFYRCLACGVFGNTKSLLRKLGGIRAIYHVPPKDDETIQVFNPFFNWLKQDTLENIMKAAWNQFNKFPQTGTYITNIRKIDEKTRRDLGIGVKDGFYTFPIWHGQKLVGAFVRSPVGASIRYFVPKGQDPNLLYMPTQNLMAKQRTLFVTFGGIDAISVGMLGFACVSTTGGKHIDYTAFDDIRKRIIFLPDKDEEDNARMIVGRLGWRGSVHLLNYPDKCKDANDYLKMDKESLQRELGEITC